MRRLSEYGEAAELESLIRSSDRSAVADALEQGDSLDGFTPLHCAASRADSLECLEMLLRAGANPGARGDEGGDTPLYLAVYYRSLRCIAPLVAAATSLPAEECSAILSEPLQWVIWAIATNNPGGRGGPFRDVLAALLDAGCPPSTPLEHGQFSLPPLNYACMHRAPEAVSLLLRHGADGSGETCYGNSAVHVVCAQLEDTGPPPPGRTAAQIAADRVLCIEELALRGAPLNIEDAVADEPLEVTLLADPRCEAVFVALLAGGCTLSSREFVEESGLVGRLRALATAAAETCDRTAALLRDAGAAAAAVAALRADVERAAAAAAGASAAAAGPARHPPPVLAQLSVLKRKPDAFPADEPFRDKAVRYSSDRPPLAAAVPLARAARATVLRSVAERVEAEAAARAVQALKAWQAMFAAAGGGEGQGEEERRQQKALDRATYVAVLWVAKWGAVSAECEQARRAGEEAEAAVEAAARQAEARAAELRGASWEEEEGGEEEEEEEQEEEEG